MYITFQKTAPVISNLAIGSQISKTIEIEEAEKKNNVKEVPLMKENQKLEADDLQDKIKQIHIEKEEKQFSQEELPQQNPEEVIAKKQTEISSAETPTVASENLDCQYAQNEINANIIVNDEDLYEQVEECYTAVALYDYQAGV